MSRKRSSGSSQCAAPETPSPVDVSAEAVTKSQSGEDDEMEESAQLAFHKRRRISRACDDCRRRKIKCDGKRPCSSCAEFNSECTYQVPSKRSKAPSHHPQRDTRDLEAKLEFAESIIRRFLPHIDLNGIGSTTHQLAQPHDSRDDVSRSDHGSAAESSMQGDTYIPLVQNEDQLRYTDSGELDFHGTSSSAAFLSHITQNFPELLRYDPRIPFLPHATRPDVPCPVPATFRGYPNYDYSRLPPRELARMLCEYSFNHASCLLKIVHVPSFYERFDALYDAQKTEYTLDEGRYVGLLYSILALGSMYDVDENNPSNPDHYNEATTRGYKFYVGARWFVPDLTECPDMTCLQALLFIIQFLQAIGNLKSCYSLIGVALRTALRMGLHRNLYNIHMNPIENETRKRVFHTIRQMDIYLSATLGLPIVLQARDIDQPLPTDIDDEYIAQDTMLAVPPGKLPIIQAFNAHVKLMEILAIVIEHVYPPRATSRSDSHATYLIDCRQLKQVEKRLHDWHRDLPAIWRPGQDNDVHLKRVQILLRFAYAHVQMMLYRPFLQYFNHQKPLGKPQDHRHRAFATTGITVCRNIISIGREIRNEATLLGPYWFILYTQFLAVLCLVSYVSHNPEAPEASDILADAVLGKGLISGLSLRSLAADRLSAALDAVFEQLPNRLGSTVLTPSYAQGRSSTAPGIAVDILSSSRSFSSPNDWLVSKSPAPRPVGIPEYPAVNYGESPTSQIPSGIMHALSDADADRVMFSFNDPIAYPSTTAWSPSQGPNSSLTDDTVHLVIPDLFSDITGRHNQPTTTAQSGDSNPASYPTSTLLSIDRGTLLNDYLSNIF